MTAGAPARVSRPAGSAWRRARQATQFGALALFVVLVLTTRGGEFPALPPTLFFRLDPLLAFASMLAARQWIVNLAWALLTVALTLLLGRVWCGWICPLGTVLDSIQPTRRRRRKNHRASLQPGADHHWRALKYVLLLVVIGLSAGGNTTLLVFDPITLLTRALASFALPAANEATVAIEAALYGFAALQPALDAFDASVRAPLFSDPVFNLWGALAFVLLVAVVAANWLAPRFWCRYLCPLGALLGVLSRVALFRRVVAASACKDCLRCSRDCPLGTIDPARAYASDPAECTVCLDCLPVCPVPAGQRFAQLHGLARAQPYDPSRRRVLATLGLAAAGAFTVPLVPERLRRSPWLIRPPGAQSSAFLSQCVRCSACVKVCPTGGLQPAVWEAGIEGFWTPTLVPRMGYCDYSCNACGQVCPTGAIPPLALPEKRAAVIGVAIIDRERCLPWAQNTPCIVCEEMCPLAPKAVELETVEAPGADGQTRTLQRPSVVPERCIGCGICEHKCPVEGAAAIRIEGA